MLALFRTLLYLYPFAYRHEYGEEMIAVLADLQNEARKKSALGRATSAFQEAGGLLYGALKEHLRAITGSYRGMFPLWRINMRNEYRFPKSAAVLMTIILVAVLLTIEKAKTVSVTYATGQTPIKTELSVLPAFSMVLVAAGILGAIGWAIVFALRRSGMHRFSDVNPTHR